MVNMSFEEADKLVSIWLRTHPSYQLIFADENDSQFHFSSTSTAISSFQIGCPHSSSPNWVVATDIDSVIPNLKAVKDYVRSVEAITITSILDFIDRTNASKSTSNSARDDEEEPVDGDDCSDQDDYDPSDFPEAQDDERTSPEGQAEGDDAEDDTLDRFTKNGSPLAVARLVKDMKNLQKSDGKFGISGCPRGENLFIWDMKLTDFPKESLLGKDLHQYAKKYNREEAVILEMTFPDSFPMHPPFVRIVRPKFKFLTGHVTIGGSICMQMLTRSGWSPTNDIEGILVQIRSAIMSDPSTKLEPGDNEYSPVEAKKAFERMVSKYNW